MAAQAMTIPTINTKGRLRSRMARWASQAEQLPQHLYAYVEMLVGVALVLGAAAIVASLYLWIVFASKLAEWLS